MTKRASTHTHLLPLQCPHCAAPLPFSTGIGHAKPKRGDLTLCGHCAGVAEFAACGLVRVELADVPAEMRAEVDRLRAALARMSAGIRRQDLVDLLERKPS